MIMQQVETGLVQLNNYYFIWRHGESEANVAEVIVSKPENGIAQWGLTDTGIEQVRRSATIVSRLSRILDHKSLIYTSPFLRCVQTAEELAQVIGVPTALTANELRERDFGTFEGKHADRYGQVYQLDRAYPGHNFFYVESTDSVSARVTDFVNRLEELYQDKVIILVTHADVGEILQASFYGIPSWKHRRLLPKLNCSSPVNLRYRRRGERVKTTCWKR